jgi:hypothetical protein
VGGSQRQEGLWMAVGEKKFYDDWLVLEPNFTLNYTSVTSGELSAVVSCFKKFQGRGENDPRWRMS